MGSGRRQSEARQRRHRFRPGLLHDRSAMVLDRSLADAEIGGDVLVGVPSSTKSMISRCRTVRLAICAAAFVSHVAVAEVSRACSSARVTLANSSSRPIGFSMK